MKNLFVLAICLIFGTSLFVSCDKGSIEELNTDSVENVLLDEEISDIEKKTILRLLNANELFEAGLTTKEVVEKISIGADKEVKDHLKMMLRVDLPELEGDNLIYDFKSGEYISDEKPKDVAQPRAWLWFRLRHATSTYSGGHYYWLMNNNCHYRGYKYFSSWRATEC